MSDLQKNIEEKIKKMTKNDLDEMIKNMFGENQKVVLNIVKNLNVDLEKFKNYTLKNLNRVIK